MKTINIEFKNQPQEDGSLRTFTVERCLVSQNGSPTIPRPQILIHLPKKFSGTVDGAFVSHEGHDYHVIGTRVKNMETNTPTEWDRYCIAERLV